MDVDINEEMPGWFYVALTNGETHNLHCQRVVVDSRAHPIWLDTTEGIRYNFQNIVSLRKAM